MELENENYVAALSTFSKLNVNDPKNTIYHYYIGEVQYALENYEGAKVYTRRDYLCQINVTHVVLGLQN